MSEFERIVEFVAAFDKRDADLSKNYGIHGVDLRMVLKGALGATQFALSTGWYLPETLGAPPDLDDWRNGAMSAYSKALHQFTISDLHPMPTDLGYHSPRPMHDGQEPMGETCIYLAEPGPCYYDGSGLNAARPFEALLREGGDGVWRVLEGYYRATFESAEAE